METPATRFHEVQLAMEFDLIQDAQAAKEIQEVDAAGQQDVLSVVHDLRGLIGCVEGVGGRATTRKPASFKNADPMARSAQGSGRRKTGETTADNNDVRHSLGCVPVDHRPNRRY